MSFSEIKGCNGRRRKKEPQTTLVRNVDQEVLGLGLLLESHHSSRATIFTQVLYNEHSLLKTPGYRQQTKPRLPFGRILQAGVDPRAVAQ